MIDSHHCPLRKKDGKPCRAVLYKSELKFRKEHMRLAHPEVYEFITGKEWFVK